jgi:hypothetical protein
MGEWQVVGGWDERMRRMSHLGRAADGPCLSAASGSERGEDGGMDRGSRGYLLMMIDDSLA